MYGIVHTNVDSVAAELEYRRRQLIRTARASHGKRYRRSVRKGH